MRSRLQKQRAVVQSLSRFHNAIATILQSRIQILTISPALILQAAGISQATGLLSNDALVVAIMLLARFDEPRQSRHGLRPRAGNYALRSGVISVGCPPPGAEASGGWPLLHGQDVRYWIAEDAVAIGGLGVERVAAARQGGAQGPVAGAVRGYDGPGRDFVAAAVIVVA